MRHHRVVIEFDESWNRRADLFIVREAIAQAVSEYAFDDEDGRWENLIVVVEE